jgi:hypothetical protein
MEDVIPPKNPLNNRCLIEFGGIYIKFGCNKKFPQKEVVKSI